MSSEQKSSSNKRYFQVIEGSFRTKVAKEHAEAISRDWETPDGKSGTKYEREVRALFGTIESIELRDGEFGKNLNIILDPDEEGVNPVISVGTSSRYGEDLMKKIPSMDLTKEYRFIPFDFEAKDTKKRNVGVSVTSRDEENNFTVKVQNYFYDGEKNTNGYPEPTDEDKEDWPFYYKKANKFLVKYLETNVCSKFQTETDGKVEYPKEEINPEDIPFGDN